ncbi:hypothetical protein V1525DRAFT_407655 [Lipomyces kononenkoae]|uniref:Uncharacterized protein n=1 Tax=Lipomyces kononenkoae TaxID=34357 RepID=A0ACC3SXR1_LIPKO
MHSSSNTGTKRATRGGVPGTTTGTSRLSGVSVTQSNGPMKICANPVANVPSLGAAFVASPSESSRTTISYLPATVTTRSPRYRQSQTPLDNGKFFYANEQTKALTSSPSDPVIPHSTRVPSRSTSRLSSSSSNSAATSVLRAKSSISTLRPHSSSPSASPPVAPPNTHQSGHAPSKFVYANGAEEVLSPRRPTLSASGSSTSAPTVYTPTPHFHPASPTFSSLSQGSAQSTGDDPDDHDTPSAVPVETDSARTNRKIMDLEISNASLLAINRTLEREMRGQSRDLRALKRWIQRHNIGGVDFDADMHSVSETDEDSSIDDESGDESKSSGDDDDEDVTIGPFSSKHSAESGKDTLSKSVLERDELVQEEKDLLEAYQAVNGSITNCIFMSDVLLKEAQASLSFKVSEEDLRLGGRVLSYDDTNYIYDYEEGVENDDVDSNTEQNDDNRVGDKGEAIENVAG